MSAPRPSVESLEARSLFSTASVPWLAEPVVAAAAPVTVRTATPAPAAATSTATRLLGGVPQFQNETTQDHALVDLVKTSSGFKNLSGGKATTGASGWPTQDFVVPLWTSSRVPAGRYNMSFNGPKDVLAVATYVPPSGKPGIKVARVSYNATTGLHTFTVDVPANVYNLTLRFTRTGGQVRNLKVFQPGYALSSTQAFTTRYVTFLKSFKPDTLRTLDLMRVNDNTTSTWAQRPQTTDATYARAGIPWPLMVQLCNAVGANLWACVPARATDDYVNNLATLLRTTLRPDLKIYVEYGNEMWAQRFGQGSWNKAQAEAEVAAGGSNLNYDGDADPYDWGDRRTARRLKQISDILEQNWLAAGQPSPINDRVRCVLGGQAARPWRVDQMLKFIDDQYNDPKDDFWSVGIATYWQLGQYQDVQLPDGTWDAPNKALTVDQVIEGMTASIKDYEDRQVFAEHVAHAAAYGLKLDCYEIGVDTHGPFNLAAKRAASLDPRMGGLMTRFLNDFYDQGGSLANWYTLGGRAYDTPSGTWAITSDINSLNQPKEQAYRTYRGLVPTV
ncbi:MAG TPA: hypothetical protein VF796_11555 [Humisphaera sp.]